jgi:ribosomal protein L22
MAEEPPRRRGRRKRGDEDEAQPAAPEESTAAESSTDEAAPEAPEESADPDAPEAAEDAPGTAEGGDADVTAAPASGGTGTRRRGSAETGAGRSRRPAPARRRARAAGATDDLVVRAQAKYVRSAPRKARLVVDHIRGKSVEEARAILRHTPRHAARDVLKLLESCVANAENNHELVADELVVHQAYVDEGPTIRRYRPRALGRATRINKRTSHMTLTLTPRRPQE